MTKKCFVGIGVLILAMALCNCKGHSGYVEVNLDWNVESGEAKKFLLDDGYVVIDSIGSAPMNEKITVYDKNGRLCGSAGAASESSGFQVVRYVYGDDDGKRLDGVVVSGVEYYDLEADSLLNYNEAKNIIVKRIISGGETVEEAIWYTFRRKGDKIVEVYDAVDSLSLKAGERHHIEYEVEEDNNFWYNDIVGGKTVVLLHIVPDDYSMEEYVIDTYCGYSLQMRSTFRNGWLCERRIYDPKTNEVCATGKMEEKGNLHIYTISNRYRYTFENGVLKTKEYISEYGTVLNQDVFFLSQDKLAYVHYVKEYDYKKKMLIKKSEERIEKELFQREHPEHDVLEMASDLHNIWWGSTYRKSKIANNHP